MISVSDATSSRCLVQASGFGGGRAAPQGTGLAFQLLKIQKNHGHLKTWIKPSTPATSAGMWISIRMTILSYMMARPSGHEKLYSLLHLRQPTRIRLRSRSLAQHVLLSEPVSLLQSKRYYVYMDLIKFCTRSKKRSKMYCAHSAIV